MKRTNRGSALLYSVMLIGALVAIMQLSFNLVVFSVLSRRQSYQDELKYWMAWGGVEAALYKIDNYTPYNSDSLLFLNWPRTAIKGFLSSTTSKYLDFSSARSYYQKATYYPRVHYYDSDFKNTLTIGSYTAVFPQIFDLKKDDSLLFDVSHYKGRLSVSFVPLGSSPGEKEKALVWFRAEDPNNQEMIEGLVRYRFVDGSSQLESLGFLFGSGENQLRLSKTKCAYKNGVEECSFVVRNFSRFRLLKIKVFNSTGQLYFSSGFGDKLGVPETLIISSGCSATDCRTLFVKFPNRLKSVSDVLDYSIYQAEF